MKKDTYILADIGGTHFRYSILKEGLLSPPVKWKLSDYKDITECFDRAVEREGLKMPFSLAIAIRDMNDFSFLEIMPFPIVLQTNDFEASARGALVLSQDEIITIYKGEKGFGNNTLICGIGTGLGFAYNLPRKEETSHILRTYGGHIVASSQTDEHHMIIDLVRRIKNKTDIVTFEDIVSGRGLPHLYQAVCMMHGIKRKDLDGVEILEQENNDMKAHTLRLFHEFFGLLVHTATITGHAFGGVYLDGGITQTLYEKELFDQASFLHFMRLNSNDIVRPALEKTPVYLIDTPFVALHGLKAMLEDH